LSDEKRCATCKHLGPYDGNEHRHLVRFRQFRHYCMLSANIDGAPINEESAAVVVPGAPCGAALFVSLDFGCVQWAEKGGGP
jgi:hypothetical protein